MATSTSFTWCSHAPMSCSLVFVPVGPSAVPGPAMAETCARKAGTLNRSACMCLSSTRQVGWINPIDGFLGNSMMNLGRATSLGSLVLFQHAPVLCHPCANRGRLAWQIPSTVTSQLTDDLVEAFRPALHEERANEAWNLWRYMAFGLDGNEGSISQGLVARVPGGSKPTAS